MTRNQSRSRSINGLAYVGRIVAQANGVRYAVSAQNGRFGHLTGLAPIICRNRTMRPLLHKGRKP